MSSCRTGTASVLMPDWRRQSLCSFASFKGCGQFLALPVSACAHNNTINKACLIFKLSYFLFFLLYVLPDGRGLCPHAGRAHTFGLVRKYAKYARGDF